MCHLFGYIKPTRGSNNAFLAQLVTSTSESLPVALLEAGASGSQWTTSLKSSVIPITSLVPYRARLADSQAATSADAVQLVADTKRSYRPQSTRFRLQTVTDGKGTCDIMRCSVNR